MNKEDLKIKILNILREDCRYSDKEISTMLDISEKNVKDLKQELEQDEIIKKYTVILDNENWKTLLFLPL